MKRTIIKIAGILLGVAFVVFLLVQLVPVDRTNPPVVTDPNWDSPETKALMERACLDCHSNQTKWPAYSYVAPVSWFVANHVHEGRRKYNVSNLTSHPVELDEVIEQIDRDKMPLPSYVILHPEARLNPAEKKLLIAGLEKTFAGQGESGDNDRDESHERDGDDDKKGAFFFGNDD